MSNPAELTAALEILAPVAARIVANARRIRADAGALACALALAAPVRGRAWRPICAHCYCMRPQADGLTAEQTTPEALVVRLVWWSGGSAGDCGACPYSGPDTLVAAIAVPLEQTDAQRNAEYFPTSAHRAAAAAAERNAISN